MKIYTVVLDNETNKLNEKIAELQFINEDSYLYVRLIIKYKINDESLKKMLLELMNDKNIIVLEVKFKDIKDDEIIVFGDISKGVTIFTNTNIKFLGNFSGNLYSEKEINVYANSFTNANVILANNHYYIDNEINYKLMKNIK